MARSTCTICDTPLQALAPAGPPVCTSLPCRWRYEALTPNQLCRICGRRLSTADQAAEACRDRECWSQLGSQRAQARQAQFKIRLEEFRDDVVERRPRLRDRGLTVIQLPGFQGPTGRVSQRRAARFGRHLHRVLKGDGPSVGNPPAVPVMPRAGLEPALARACGACRGNCCQNGGDHAYLSKAKLEEIENTLGLTHDELVERYLTHIPVRHYTQSCIYHMPNGCALPRELRSDTCNNFFCDPLHEFLSLAEARPETPVLLTSVRRYRIRSGVVVDAGQIEQVKDVASSTRPVPV